MKKEPCRISQYHVRAYRELFEKLNKELKEIKAPDGIQVDIVFRRKIQHTYRTVVEELRNIVNALIAIEKCGEYYVELFKAYTGESIDSYRSLIRKRMKQARLIYREIDEALSSRSTTRRDTIEVFRKGLGRLLSIYKRSNKRIVILKNYIKEISKMPDIRGDYVVVLAGLPQVGKSTILSKLTSAKPEIGVYPFTTKTLIAGHIDVDYLGRLVLIDSPGILDSPIEEKNLIEQKAILAIKHLADHIVYVFAVYPEFYYTLKEQLNVYRMILELLGEKNITVVLNKVDLLSSEMISETTRLIREHIGRDPLPVSALTGYNMDRLKEILVESFRKRGLYQ